MACLSHLLVPDGNRPTVYTLGFEKYGQQEVHTLVIKDIINTPLLGVANLG